MASQDKEGLILDAAKELITRYGLDKTTVAEIAAKAGIAKGTVYLYFKSKEEIYYSLLTREAEGFKEVILPKLEKARDPVDELRIFLVEVGKAKLFNEFAIQSLKQDYLPKILGYASSSRGTQISDEWFKFLADMIKQGIDQGYFREVEPTLVSMSIYTTISGLMMLTVFGGKEFTSDQVMALLETSVDLIVQGLVKGEHK